MKKTQKSIRQRRWKQNYSKLKKRFHRALQTGTYHEWSRRKQHQLQTRLTRYAKHLLQPLPSLVGKAALGAALALSPIGHQAQNAAASNFPIQELNETMIPLVSVTLNTTSVEEDSGEELVYTFSRTGSLGEELVVKFSLSGTASFGDDFEISGETSFSTNTNEGTITIPAGSGSVDLIVVPFNDMQVEDSESIMVSISGTQPVFTTSLLKPFGLPDIGTNSNPSFADIDQDGDLDAFIGERRGDIIYFENNGNSSFVATQKNPFGLENIGSSASPSFADIDNDGDLDAFIGNYDGNIIYFENDGGLFTAIQTNPFGLQDVGFNSNPSFADIDNDGDLDAFVGNNDGDVIYFENNGGLFTATQTNPFGLQNVGSNSTLFLSNTSPDFIDIDNDGDLDAFIGERRGNIIYFENNGSGSFTATQTNPFRLKDIGSSASPSFADIDNDGDLDIFIGTSYGDIIYFKNNDSGSFTSIQTNSFGLTEVGNYSNPSFVDIDDDGDLDAFVGNNYGNIIYFENNSNGSFTATQTNPFGLSRVNGRPHPSFADIDQDGDLDAFIGKYGGNIIYFENNGNGSFTATQTNPFGLKATVNNASPSFADIDGDGDIDAFVGNLDGFITYYENNGSGSFTATQTNPFGLTDIGTHSRPEFIDIDLDGDLDAFVGGRHGNIIYFENNGSGSFIATQTNPFGLEDIGANASPSFADIDQDGDIDAFIGERIGNIIYFENIINLTYKIDKNTNTQTGIIQNDDLRVNLHISPNNVIENDEEPLVYTFTRNGLTTEDLTVTFHISGTATADIDYMVNGTNTFNADTGEGTITIPMGHSSANLIVTPIADTEIENNESVLVNITTTSDLAYTANTNTGTVKGIIQEDDFAQVSVNLTSTNVVEDSGNALIYSFERTDETTKDLIISFSLDGTAIIGTDYTISGETTFNPNKKTGTITIPAGSNSVDLTITPVTDTEVENNESVIVNILDVPTLFNASPLQPFGLTSVGYFANPSFADIDGDGDLDAFIGNRNGDIIYFENDGNGSFMTTQTNPFGLTDVGTLASPSFADIDNDGDLDAFIGNIDNEIIYFENNGNGSFTATQINPFGFVDIDNFVHPSFADIDNDGDLDAFIGELDRIRYFENDGSGSFTATQINPFGLVNLGYFANPSFVDIDNDGDLDAFIGTGAGTVLYHENHNGSFNNSFLNSFGLTKVRLFSSPTFVDMDGDEDLDAFIGEGYGNTIYFENNNGSFTATQTNPFGLKNVGDIANPSFADIDNDGDLDAFVGEYSMGIIYFENNDNGFTATQTNPFELMLIERRTAPSFADIDNDGDLDALIGNRGGNLVFFENDGNGLFTATQTNPFGLMRTDNDSNSCFVDIDSDGDLDVFVGGLNGNLVFFENNGDGSFTATQTNPFGLVRVGNYSNPSFMDIDSDGDLDAFIGERNGHTIFFENISNGRYKIDPNATTQTGIIQNDDAPLPIEWLNFTGHLTKAQQTQLNWKLSTTSKLKHFVVERSINGQQFEEIAMIDATDIAVNETVRYAYLDKTPQTGLNYYRIQTVEQDGASAYSSVVVVQLNQSTVEGNLILYPNPNNGQVTLQLPVIFDSSTGIELTILNTIGQVIAYQKQVSGLLNHRFHLPTAYLPKGIYLVQVRQGEIVEVARMVMK